MNVQTVAAIDICAHLVDKIAGQDGLYLRRRRLLDGPDQHATDLIETLVSDLIETQTGAVQSAFIAHVSTIRAEAKPAVLLAASWLALTRHNWSACEVLARELVGRDHHDLLAQRLIDAAAEQSETLETEIDRWLATRTCRAPFTEMESRTNGQIHFCCSAWQPVPIGRLEDKEGFWNSARAQEIRRSVLDGDFSHCSRWHCPAIAGRKLPERAPDDAKRLRARAEPGPERVILSHDRSCNISCPSCRTKLINLPHRETSRLNEVFEQHLLPLVSKARQIKVTGSGDPFGSRHFRHLIGQLTATDAEGRRIQLHTNGLLANLKAWNDLNLWDNVSSVWISIDAATSGTYSVLRRGGDFDTLVRNLHFLGGLNAADAIDTLRLDFVVQQMNFREMKAFVDLSKEVGADGTYFLRLRNWGHVPAAEFRELDVCSPDHPEHSDLLAVLADDRFVAPGVDLGSMSQLVAKARAARAQS